MITKIITLSLIIFFILLIFRFFSNFKKSNINKKNLKDNVVDLEKDPQTDEYKPKE